MKIRAFFPPVLGCGLVAVGFWLSSFSLLGAVPGDEHWDSQFGPVGVNLPLDAIAVCKNKVFVTGYLTAAGNTRANYVAGFDGTNWFPLNGGVSGNGVAMIGMGSDRTNVYVGGLFTNADNSGAQYVARWDGTNWSPMGSGLNGPPYVFKQTGGNLYVGGVFTAAGNTPVNGIARWDGTNWWPLGAGVLGCTGQFCSSGVTCIAFQGNNIYVGGNFTSAGVVNAINVAYYDGSTWYSMGNPFNGPVNALAFYGAYLYAGGSFTNASLGFTNLARWDGSSWTVVPGGNANSPVLDFATDGTNLFTCGQFTQIGGVTANRIASWNGSVWSTLSSGIQGVGVSPLPLGVYKMVWQSNQLYVAGSFSTAGNIGANCVARWDGTNWWDLGGKTSKGMTYFIGFVQSLLPVGGTNLYAGGLFSQAGNVLANGVARWDGTNWHSLSNGVTGTYVAGVGVTVKSMAVIGTNFFAAGNFTNAGGIAAKGVARWDGSNWWALGSGVDYYGRALTVANGTNLYVGGSFTNAGGILSKGVSLWYGNSWHNLNGGVDGPSGISVNALAYDGTSNIYAGGIFTIAGGISATNIARWDGSFWWPVGTGVNGGVNTLVFTNGMLYAGGTFTAAGGVSANRIAAWNGTTWSALGTGLTGYGPQVNVSAILVVGGNIYVNGNFTNAGGLYVNNIAKWNGTGWTNLGSGLVGSGSSLGYSLASMGNDIFVGGQFSFAGDKPAEFFTRWNDQLNFYPPANMQLIRTAWLTNHQFQFRLVGTSGQSYIILGTTNFSVWTPLLTNSTMFYDFIDPNSTAFPRRFYRALLGP